MKKNNARSQKNNKVKAKFEQEELKHLQQDAAMQTVLPYAGDLTPYARKDLSSSLTRLLNSWNSRGTNVCLFKENIVVSPVYIAQQALTTNTGAILVTLSLAGNLSAYTALFDQYRIVAIVITLTPTINMNAIVATSVYMPRLYTCIDYDDATAPGSVNAIQQYDSCIVSPPFSAITRIIKPCMALAAYSGTFSSYANVSDQWIDMASPSVQHYGMKYAVEPGTSGQTTLQGYETETVMFFECRNQR